MRSIKNHQALGDACFNIVCCDRPDPRTFESLEFYTALSIYLGKGRTRLLVTRSPSLVRPFLLLASQLEVVKVKTRRTHVQLSWRWWFPSWHLRDSSWFEEEHCNQ